MADENTEQEFNKEEFVAGIKAKYGGAADVAISVLGEEAKRNRQTIRELKAKLPVDGAVVLSQDEAKQFKAFQDLGIDSAKAKEAIDRIPALETENKKLVKRDSLRDVAKFGYNLDVLEEQMEKFPDAVFTTKKIKDAKDATKEIAVPYVTHDGKESSFEEFAEEKLASYLPALKVNSEAQTNYKPGIPQMPSVSGGHDSTFDRIRKDAEEKRKNQSAQTDWRALAGKI